MEINNIENLVKFKDGKKVLLDGPLSRIFTQILHDEYAKEIEKESGMVLESQVMQVEAVAKNYLESELVVGIFPEGTRVKEGERIPPASGFIVFAVKTKSPIIPVRIKGEYRFRHKIDVIIGEPIFLTDYYGKKIPEAEIQKLGEEIMDKIYSLE